MNTNSHTLHVLLLFTSVGVYAVQIDCGLGVSLDLEAGCDLSLAQTTSFLKCLPPMAVLPAM